MPLIATGAPRAAAPELTAPRRVNSLAAGSSAAWSLLTWIGGAFVLLGFADIALGWYPAAFGNGEWEFGTISGSLNALPIPMLGLFLLGASALARGSKGMSRTVAALMGLLALVVVGLGVVYLTVIPLALKTTAANPIIQLGMKKAIGKGLMLGTLNFVLLAVGAVKLWKGPSEAA